MFKGFIEKLKTRKTKSGKQYSSDDTSIDSQEFAVTSSADDYSTKVTADFIADSTVEAVAVDGLAVQNTTTVGTKKGFFRKRAGESNGETAVKTKKVLTKKQLAIRIVAFTLAGILAILAIAVFTLLGMFSKELKSVNSFTRLTEKVYYIDYKNDYYLDEYEKQGARTDKELIEFITKKLLKGLPIKISLPDFGCSSFTAQTSIGSDSEKLYGRNYDMSTFSPTLITRTQPKGGYKSLATTDLSALGFKGEKVPTTFMQKMICLAAPYAPFDGINEKGVTLNVNMVKGEKTRQDTGKVPFTTSVMIRMVLDRCASVDEALTLIKKFDMNDSTGGPFHFQIADASGDSAIVEYLHNEMKITRKSSNDKYLAMTNFPVNPVFKADSVNELRDNYGSDRYNVIKAKLDSVGGILSEDGVRLLLKDAINRKKDEQSGEMVDRTVWANVFNLTKKTMTLYPYSQFDEKFAIKLAV